MNRQRILLLALFIGYWMVSLRHLSVVPPVYEDEPWQASTGWKLAQEGVFGSDLFRGMFGMEHHYYGYMPLHPLLLALTYRLAGLGLFQSRYETVVLGLITLALTYRLGRRLFGQNVALLAVALLLLVRTAGLTRSQATGIILLDFARIARYDMTVPVFGLLCLLAYIAGRNSGFAPRWAGLAGLLAGLAGLGHLYGVFWLGALALLMVWDRAGWRSLASLGLGFALPWLAYLGYVLNGLGDWAQQVRGYGPRFDLLRPAFYWSNLINELKRYGPGLGPPGWHYLLRPGFFAAAAVWPAALVWLLWRGGQGDWRARVVALPLLVLQSAFGLLLALKLSNYLVTIFPLAAIAAAWALVRLWRAAGRTPRGRWLRVALAAVGLVVAAEGVSRIAALEAAARATTPYASVIARVRQSVSPEARLLVMHAYWFGLEDLDVRTWLVPWSLADSTLAGEPSPMKAALSRVDPDIIVIDTTVWEYFSFAAPSDSKPQATLEWMHEQGFALVAVVSDPTYGQFDIYRRQP